MKVILKTDIKKIGKQGDIVEVAGGFACNYLFVKGLAIEATTKNINANTSKAKIEDINTKKNKENSKILLSSLPKQLTIKTKANDKGVLFNSLTPEMILKELNKETNEDYSGFEFQIDGDIKMLGEHKLTISDKNDKKSLPIVVEKDNEK